MDVSQSCLIKLSLTMLHLQHPTHCPERVLPSKTLIQKKVVQWIMVLWESVQCRMVLVVCKDISSTSQILSQLKQNNIFQIVEDFNAHMNMQFIEQHIISKWSVKRRKELTPTPKTPAIFKLHSQFTVIVLTVKRAISSPLILVGRIQGYLYEPYYIIYDMGHKGSHLGYTATFIVNCVSCTQAMSLLGYKEAQAPRLQSLLQSR